MALLITSKWNKEKLIDLYYSSPERVLADAGLATSPSDVLSPSPSSPRECPICYTPLGGPEETTSLSCRHMFCRDCFGTYLKVQIEEGPGCIRTHCPQHKCRRAVPAAVYEALLDAPVYEKYHSFVVRDYISASRNMRWCPAPGCNM